MDIESQIGDILACYWLVENRYCGLAESQVLKRLSKVTSNSPTIDELHSRLLTMQAGGEVVIGRPEADPTVFPRRPLLEPRDPVKENEVGIYARQLRLGGSQIALRYFDRQVLDRYRQDPRYQFKELAVSGHISTPSNAPNILLKDRVYIRFGRACHPNGTPVVATILFDLGELPKQHQQYWASYEINEDCQPDADFIKQNFDAEPIERISPPSALLSELQEINRICELTGEPVLFRETYESHKLLKLGLITKPTADAFWSFVNELDKLLSQNINKKFFKNKVDLVDTQGAAKGTLMLLSKYLESCGLTSSEVIHICKPLRDVRKRRQIPAHKITEDEFNTDYWVQQNELIKNVLKAVHLLRNVFERHPNLKDKNYMPPKWLNG